MANPKYNSKETKLLSAMGITSPVRELNLGQVSHLITLLNSGELSAVSLMTQDQTKIIFNNGYKWREDPTASLWHPKIRVYSDCISRLDEIHQQISPTTYQEPPAQIFPSHYPDPFAGGKSDGQAHCPTRLPPRG